VRTVSRRGLLAIGATAVGVAAAAPYVVLIPGQEFEELVAGVLGLEVDRTAVLLERVRDEYGSPEYEARATAFALAVRDPAASLVPDRLRSSAIRAFLDPMFETPAAALAFAKGRDPSVEACAGLVRAS
jgi:hypothetical protein